MIIIDKRENRSKVPELLDKLKVEYIYDTLEIGDYLIGDFCIERKSINDFISSVNGGRIYRQLYNMSRNYKKSYLCVIGYLDEIEFNRSMDKRPYIAAMVGVTLKKSIEGEQGDINILNFTSDYDFVLFLKYLDDKIDDESPRLPRYGKKKYVNEDEEILYILSSIEGLGEKKAKSILKRYKTLNKVANASIDDLMKIEGIGKKLASKIYEIFRKEYKGD